GSSATAGALSPFGSRKRGPTCPRRVTLKKDQIPRPRETLPPKVTRLGRATNATLSLIPGLVLDRRRQPDPLVDPLEILFLGDFLLSRNLCVLRLRGTGEIVPIQPRCGNQAGYRAPTSRAALEGRVIHPMHHLVHDQAGRAFVFINL